MSNVVKFFRTHPDAVIPSKAHATDAGWDLVAIKQHKKIGGSTFLYDTGIVIAPPPGFFVEIRARSSISKSGYIITNGVGTIDNGYRGNLYIALTKVDPAMPDLKPPFCLAQLVLVKMHGEVLEEVNDTDSLGNSSRGDGGFGSTGNRVD